MATKSQSPALISATTNITRASESLTTAYENLKSLASQAEDLDVTIAGKNKAIEELDVEFDNRFRQAEVDLSIKVKQGVKTVVDEYLTSNNLEALDATEVARLKNVEKTVTQQAEKDKTAALVQQDKALRTEFTSAVEVLKAQQNAALAEANANNKSLQDKVDFLTKQVQDLFNQLSEQRQADIDRVKAANPVQNITNVTEVAKK